MIRALACAAAVAWLGACSIDRRTDDLSCEDDGDCQDGRDCVDGYCVYGRGADGDGPDASPDCPSPCTLCTGGQGANRTCVVSCNGSDVCPDAIACPAGLRCQVTCNGTSACSGGVDCGEATECTVVCSGDAACAAGVACGAGACDVTCTDTGACDVGVDCTASCACDVSCSPDACGGGVDCTAETCETATGCSSDEASCNSCN